MALEMKNKCENCQAATPQDSPVEEQPFICSHECTYCESCAMELSYHCPNCKGLLVRRPPRRKAE